MLALNPELSFVKPKLSSCHDVPLSVDLTIALGIPANMVEPFAVTQFMCCNGDMPVPASVDQLFPISVERQRPEAVPAKSFVPLAVKAVIKY
jgi:hypothetical protein